jgi:hypothetical protein
MGDKIVSRMFTQVTVLWGNDLMLNNDFSCNYNELTDTTTTAKK